MKKEFYDDLADNIKSPFKYNVSLKKYTSLKIGGPCLMLIKIENDNDLVKSLNYFREKGVPFFLLGNGSNLLVSDKGFPGVILKLGQKYNYLKVDRVKNGTCLVNAGASKLFPNLAMELAKEGISGVEWGCKIPGTLGGATIMNAGAHGGDMSKVVTKIEGIDINSGKKVILAEDDLKYEYRRLNTGDKSMIITSIWMSLKQDNSRLILDRIEKYKETRKTKQPNLPNAGSVFKNPPGDYAGRLLEECGMKGYQIGDVKFSEKHANFIVNKNMGKSSDVWKLIERAREEVNEKFGVYLSLELDVLGEINHV